MSVGVLQRCHIVSSNDFDGVVVAIHLIVSCGLYGLIFVAVALYYFHFGIKILVALLLVVLFVHYLSVVGGWKVSADCFLSVHNILCLCEFLAMEVITPPPRQEEGRKE